jgi:osmotically-inducible protein OsmY
MATALVRSDARTQLEVIRELKWDGRVEETDIGVEVDNGVVTLTGTVSSYAKAFAAQEAAHRVDGVLDVANEIQVRLPGHPRQTNTELARAVREALKADVKVPDAGITSTVSRGWVTLQGTVEFSDQRHEAERAIRRLPGVGGVTNDIAVTTAELDPDLLRGAIERVLDDTPGDEAGSIKVTIDEGAVTLTGIVLSAREKQAVVEAATGAQGVRSVRDQLRIESAS